MRINYKNQESLINQWNNYKQVDQLQYFCNLVTKTGGSDEDIYQRIKMQKYI